MNHGKIVQVGTPVGHLRVPGHAASSPISSARSTCSRARVIEESPTSCASSASELGCAVRDRACRRLRPRRHRVDRHPAREDQHQSPPARGRRRGGRERGARHGARDRLHGRHVDLPGADRLRQDAARDAAQHHPWRRATAWRARRRVWLSWHGSSPVVLTRVARVRLTQRSGQRLVAGIPTLWLLVLFLIPFVIVFKISFSEVRLAMPPYTPLLSWHARCAAPRAALVGVLVPVHRSAVHQLLPVLAEGGRGLDAVLPADRLSDGLCDRALGQRACAHRAADADRAAVLDLVPAARVCVDRAAEEQRRHQQRAAVPRRHPSSRWRCCRPISRCTSASSIPTCRS